MEYASRKLVFVVALLIFAAGITNIGAEEGTGGNNDVVDIEVPTCKLTCLHPCHCQKERCVCNGGPLPRRAASRSSFVAADQHLI
ncbi:unnamed protein product [Linum tenue]|uniref:Uncharacterized protein n=1 Tax=Linum tenue TaxID=586396 RepID=A0AAV0IJE3_9ROSI|nr:unnamed protein product [Linum tenue]